MEIYLDGEPSSGKSFFAECFKNEPKRKIITLFDNKRKKIVKSKYQKRFVNSKYYMPKLKKKIKGTVNRHQMVMGATSRGHSSRLSDYVYKNYFKKEDIKQIGY